MAKIDFRGLMHRLCTVVICCVWDTMRAAPWETDWEEPPEFVLLCLRYPWRFSMKLKLRGRGGIWSGDKADENVLSPMTLGFISDVSTWAFFRKTNVAGTDLIEEKGCLATGSGIKGPVQWEKSSGMSPSHGCSQLSDKLIHGCWHQNGKMEYTISNWSLSDWSGSVALLCFP